MGDIRRFGSFNDTFRILASAPVGEVTGYNNSGILVHEQFSWTRLELVLEL